MVGNVNYGMRFLNSRWMLPKQLYHLSIFGATGSGKSQSLVSISQRAYLRGCKIFDLYSAGGMEGAYWSLPSNHPFWKDREFTFQKQTLKARDFPIKCLIPMHPGIPGELPDIFKPFTIPITSLTEKDLKAMLGNALTKNELALWNKVHEKINKNTTIHDLLNYIIDAQKKEERIPGIHATGISSIYNMLKIFERHQLLTCENNPLSLDLESEIRDKKTITSLLLNYYPEQYHGFIVNHFMYKIYELMLKNEIKHPVILLIREAGDFLVNATEASPQELAVQDNFIHVVRKGRKFGLFTWIDNQTPLNLNIVKGEFKIKICHYVDNTVTLASALGDLGEMLLTREDYMNLRSFPPGRCFVLEERGLFAPQMFPPLTRMSGEEQSNFIELWRKEKGAARFINTKPLINPVKDEYQKSEEEWKTKIKERKERDKIKKELIKRRNIENKK